MLLEQSNSFFLGIINDMWNFCSEPLGHHDTKGNLNLTVSTHHEITVSLTDNKIVNCKILKLMSSN